MMSKKLFQTALCMALLLCGATALVPSAEAQRDESRQILGLTYPEGPTISVKLAGTTRLPRASGEAKVERKKGITEIEMELDEMKPAFLFGGDYNTYVLWVASPEGHVDNLGEFILSGNRSKLNVSTPLESFGMFVTAEPHFLVDTPSRFVVIENSRPTERVGLTNVSKISYSGFEGVYDFERETLLNLPEQDAMRPHVAEAATAVELARRAGAEKFAPEELSAAQDQLRQAQAISSSDPRNQMLSGHKAIRLAVEAQKLAEKRSFQAALDAERESNAQRIAGLKTDIEAAQSEAERARLEAEQKALRLEMEEAARKKAQVRADQAAREAAEARRQAQMEARERRRAEAAAAEAAREAASAKDVAADAISERDRARQELRSALETVVNIRETARGLILDLPDILFDFDKATLKPNAREILAKISGVLLIADQYTLRVEGHTDSIGSEEYNLDLSRKRAASVHDYLRASGIAADRISYEGHGENDPVASNDTAEGRQQNRRVEIHVEETPEHPIASP